MTLHIRDLTEHPSFQVDEPEANRVHAAYNAGPTRGKHWAVTIADIDGGRTTIGLDGVLWVNDEEAADAE